MSKIVAVEAQLVWLAAMLKVLKRESSYHREHIPAASEKSVGKRLLIRARI